MGGSGPSDAGTEESPTAIVPAGRGPSAARARRAPPAAPTPRGRREGPSGDPERRGVSSASSPRRRHDRGRARRHPPAPRGRGSCSRPRGARRAPEPWPQKQARKMDSPGRIRKSHEQDLPDASSSRRPRSIANLRPIPVAPRSILARHPDRDALVAQQPAQRAAIPILHPTYALRGAASAASAASSPAAKVTPPPPWLPLPPR